MLYGGVLAGNAAWRCEVVPKAPSSTDAEKAERRARKLVKAGRPCAAEEEPKPGWSELLKRVFGVDGWQWSNATPAHCKKPMKLRTIVVRAPASVQIVASLTRGQGPPEG